MSKHINIIMEPDEFRDVAISCAVASLPTETKKQFYARALVKGAQALSAEKITPSTRGKK